MVTDLIAVVTDHNIRRLQMRTRHGVLFAVTQRVIASGGELAVGVHFGASVLSRVERYVVLDVRLDEGHDDRRITAV